MLLDIQFETSALMTPKLSSKHQSQCDPIYLLENSKFKNPKRILRGPLG